MIDFSLSKEQKQLVESAKEFSAGVIKPAALEADEKGEFPEEILKKAHELGFLYTNIPKEYGGTGMNHIDHYIVTEALNFDCCAIGQMIGISHLGTGAIEIGGTEEQKKKFLGKMTESHRSACFCLTEPEAGSDADNGREKRG